MKIFIKDEQGGTFLVTVLKISLTDFDMVALEKKFKITSFKLYGCLIPYSVKLWETVSLFPSTNLCAYILG